MSIFKYKRVVTPGPDGSTIYFKNSQKNEAIELAEIDGWHFVFVPPNATLPEQPVDIEWQEVAATQAIKDQISFVSGRVKLINAQIVQMIRERYSIDDEIKLLRIAPSEETSAWNAYVEDCRAWGRSQKAALGL